MGNREITDRELEAMGELSAFMYEHGLKSFVFPADDGKWDVTVSHFADWWSITKTSTDLATAVRDAIRSARSHLEIVEPPR